MYRNECIIRLLLVPSVTETLGVGTVVLGVDLMAELEGETDVILLDGVILGVALMPEVKEEVK